jgi:hypothetical protein
MRNEVTGDILDVKHKYFEQYSDSDGRIRAIRLVRAEVNQSLSSASRVRAGDHQLNLAPYLVEPEPPEEPDDDGERECGCTCDFPCSVEQPNACACGRCSIASLDF